MSEGPLDVLAAELLESLAAVPSHPLPVGVHGRLMAFRFALPRTPVCSIRLRNISADATVHAELHQRLGLMVAFVRHHLRNVCLAVHLVDLRLGLIDTRQDRLAIGLSGVVDLSRKHQVRVQIHHVLGLVGQVRPPVLHLHDAAVRIAGRFPLFVGNLLVLPLFVEPSQLFVGRVLDARFFGQFPQILLPVFAGLFANDRLHRRIGFQRRGIHRHRAASKQPLLSRQLQHEGEDLLMDRKGEPLADLRQAGMVRAALLGFQAQEIPQRQTVAATPGNATLGVDALEVTHEEHPKVPTRRDRRTASLGIVALAEGLDESVEVSLHQELLQPLVEWVACRFRQVPSSDPELLLPFFRSASQCHTAAPFPSTKSNWGHHNLSRTFSTGC
jgi:hypothetical protein